MELTKNKDFDVINSVLDEQLEKAVSDIDDPELKVKVYKKIIEILDENQKKSEALYTKSNRAINSEELIQCYTDYLFGEGRSEATVYDYRIVVNRFLKYLKKSSLSLATLDRTELDKYFSARKNSKLKINSFAKEKVLIKMFVDYLNSYGYTKIDTSKIKIPKKAPVNRELLSTDEIKKVEDYLNSRVERFDHENLRDKVVFYLGILCGLRRNEKIKLNWEDIDLVKRRMMILESKGGKSRPMYFNKKLEEVLRDYQKSIKIYKGAVVRGLPGKRRISKCALQDIIHKKLFLKLGIYRPGLTTHSLRHNFATEFHRKNESIFILRDSLGHKDVRTTQIYVHNSEEDLKKAVDRVIA